jgi:hydroxymethylpyrimidine pyrophosphatase-like HAD family hydrolase
VADLPQTYVFDLDDTLIRSNKQRLLDSVYLDVYGAFEDFLEPDISRFRDLLARSKTENIKVYILTNRDPTCRHHISKLLKIPEAFVLCRDHDLVELKGRVWLEAVNADKELLKGFFDRMWVCKGNHLRRLAKKGKVIYYDDLIGSEFWASEKMPHENIEYSIPMHMLGPIKEEE